MKKIIALALAAAFSLPTFALSVKIGDEISYVPVRGVSTSHVTRIAQTSIGGYYFDITVDGTTYTYVVKEGDELDLYSKAPKAKNSSAKKLKIKSIGNNYAEIEDITPTNSYVDAK